MANNYIVKFSVDHSREETVPIGAAPNKSGNDFLVVIAVVPRSQKTCLRDLGTTKVQTSLRIRADCSAPL